MEQDFQQLIKTEKLTTQTKWRSAHANILGFFSVLVILVELVIFYILTGTGLRSYTLKEYIFSFMLFPDLGYVILNLIVLFINKSTKISNNVKNYTTCLSFSAFCLLICYFHDYFATIFGCGMIAISLTIIYCDVTLTLICAGCIFTGEALIGFVSHWDALVAKTPLYDSYVIMALILIIIATMASIITIRWEDRRIIFISEKQMQISQLREQTIIDPLTGLHNRRALRQFIDESTKSISYAMLDIDHFKRVNDSFGHETGDDILITFSKVVQKYQGEKIQVFRFGGDEFLFAFMSCSLKEIEDMCKMIQADFLKAIPKEVHNLGVCLSVGIASYKQDELPHDAIQRADNALYVAKVDKNNKVTIV